MTQPTPIAPFILTFPRDEKGEEVKYRFMLTLSKKLGYKIGTENIASRLHKALSETDGIDSISSPIGMYTIEVSIARTFNPDVVLAELKRRITEDVLSEIIKPVLVVP